MNTRDLIRFTQLFATPFIASPDQQKLIYFHSAAAIMLIETILLQEKAASTRHNQLSMEITRTNIHCS